MVVAAIVLTCKMDAPGLRVVAARCWVASRRGVVSGGPRRGGMRRKRRMLDEGRYVQQHDGEGEGEEARNGVSQRRAVSRCEGEEDGRAVVGVGVKWRARGA